MNYKKNYEEKYKEALENIRKIKEENKDNNELVEFIEFKFPELRESEDERIKRCISDAVRKYGVEFATGTVTKEKMLAWLEKQGEQKLIDKVEPKFKVGDWCIDNEDGTIFQIVKVLDNSYMYKTNEGKEYSCSHYSLEIDAKLWTIQDAKEGDVLADDDEVTGCPFIFHYLTEEQNPRSYCGVDTSGHFQVNDENGEFWCSSYKVKPATKEQRDLLFKKMKEAGYEWDADNKELKKIEQNPTERSLPYEKNETVEKLIALAECLEMDGDCLFNGLSGDDYGKLLRVLAIELTEVKSDWSEENEEIIKEACKIINCYGNIITEQNEANKAYRIADKLKSLKDRIKKAKYI